MTRIIKLLDVIAFALFGAVFAAAITTVVGISSLFGRRRFCRKRVNRLSFAICDLMNNRYDGMLGDVLLGDYISKDYYIYLDYNNARDRYADISGRIFFHSIAAHPEGTLYSAGFRKTNMLMVEVRMLARAFSIARNKGISFVKSHDPHLLGLNAFIVARLFRIPYILHLNSDFDMKYKGLGRTSSPVFLSRSIERIFERAIIMSADMIMADRMLYRNSRSLPESRKGRYRPFGVRVAERHYGDLSSRKNLAKELGVEGRKIVFYAGRLHPVKYPEDVLAAMSIIKKSVEGAVLVMAGGGPMRAVLEDMARSMGLGGSVIFLGPRSNDELADLLYTADVFLAPHGGVTLVEAALAAAPIVAYDFDWHSEFIESGKMGYLVPFRDAAGMAKKAIEILTDDPLRKYMADNCRKTALEKCSRKSSIANERKVYEELLGCAAN
jgi:glycosyltransferase involved in cell wall biosynthesis